MDIYECVGWTFIFASPVWLLVHAMFLRYPFDIDE